MAAAGWYPDPSDPTAQRYWDGTAWTEHKAPAAGYAPPPVGQPVFGQPAAGYGQPYAAQPAYGQPAAGYGQPYAAQSAYGQPGSGYVQQGPPIRKFGFGEAVKRGLSQWTDYSGRATVAEYWWFTLFQLLVLMPLYIIFLVVDVVVVGTSTKVDSTTGQSTSNISSGGVITLVILAIVLFVVALLFFFPHLALLVRRLHDTDKSGWWCLISFVPFGGLVILIFTLMPATPGPNQYGPPVT
jgi:uncharacterized membrane protein YhaH (DUF805 family)